LGNTTAILPAEVHDKRFLTIHQPEKFWDIHVDFNIPPHFMSQAILPDRDSLNAKVEEWVAKRLLEPDNQVFRFAVFQLARFKENGLRALRTAMMNLANRIRKDEPDYFMLIEMLMRGHIKPEEFPRSSNGKVVVVVSDIPVPKKVQ
jgi:hypothetical protein